MNEANKQRYIYIEGQAVPVSEDVYRVCKHYERKEEYFSRDLKSERFQRITNTFLPSREDSYERLLNQGKQFAGESNPVEEEAVSSVWMAELFHHLTDEERQIIEQLYILERTEREAWGNPGHPRRDKCSPGGIRTSRGTWTRRSSGSGRPWKRRRRPPLTLRSGWN